MVSGAASTHGPPEAALAAATAAAAAGYAAANTPGAIATLAPNRATSPGTAVLSFLLFRSFANFLYSKWRTYIVTPASSPPL